MEYFRDPKNQIQADFAYRVGKIALQYESIRDSSGSDSYEATLNICLLQSLLTTCFELIRAMRRHERRTSYFSAPFIDIPSFWGLRRSMVKVDTFRHSTLTHEDVINYLRNALSHPTELHVEADYPSTGYTTPGGTAYITDFVFVASPDVRGDHPILHRERDVAERALRDMGNPSDLRIQEIRRGNSISYQIWNHEDKPYARIFKIDIPVTSLKALVLGLSNHLSQPMQNNWDGETVNQLLVR